MEIPRWSYFLFWATIGVVFSRLGFNALDKTELSNAVPPPVLSFFKHSLAISTAYSSIHAFLFSPPRKPINKWILLYAVIIWIVIYYPVSTQEGPDHKTALIAHLAVGSSMLLVGDRKKFLPCAVSSIALLISVPCLAMSENETFHKLMRLVARANTVVLSLKEKSGKLTEFAVGMVGTILFQNFFRLTSFNHVVAFLYFAVGWLANLALLRPSDDLGIFNFLLSNVVVGCTVSQFGLRPTTWLVYGGSILLFGLRLKIQALTLVDNGEEDQVIVL
ncbi:uncharacterized protein LOC105164097 [Sesamum indicum]|uniref:Uncharacterized protein LOC105164097 n=1 Tax=Sesamum indicum TaxID=4182 RepID=A0A6I9T9G2_SESIN|nr:uncharacterized protein LOC105164097 [Sesamum indicum]